MAKGYISGTVNTPTYESVAYEGKETTTAVTSVDNTPSNRTIEVNIKTDFLENTYAAKSDLTSSVNSLGDRITEEKVRATEVEDNLSTSIDSERSDRESADREINNTITDHVDNKNNPHSVTAEQLGLGNVVNTGDSATPTENGVTKFTTGGAFSLKDTLTSAINDETARATAAETKLSNQMVTIDSDQDIVGDKHFTGHFYAQDSGGDYYISITNDSVYMGGYVEVRGTLYATESLDTATLIAPVIKAPRCNYGLSVPNGSSWTANKTIATTDQLPDDNNLVHKTGDETINGNKAFIGDVYTDKITIDGRALFNANVILDGVTINENQDGYGLRLPDTSDYSDNHTIATINDVPDDSNLVHKGTSSSLSNEDIYGTKKWKSGNIILGDASQDTDHSQVTITKDAISKNAGAGGNAFYLGDNTLKLGYAATETTYKIELNADAIVKKTNPSTTYTYTFPTKTGTIALTSDCGTKLYKHSISIGGVAGSLNLYTTSDVKFTTMAQVSSCINYSYFKSGIYLNGNFGGPSSLLTVFAVNAGAIVGLNYSNAIATISYSSSATITDTVTAL